MTARSVPTAKNPRNLLRGVSNVSIPGVSDSAIIARIRHHLAISTGSACSSGIETPSHVLSAIGLSSPAIEGALRLGLGKFATDAEVEQAAAILVRAVAEIRQLLCRSG